MEQSSLDGKPPPPVDDASFRVLFESAPQAIIVTDEFERHSLGECARVPHVRLGAG